MSMDAPDTRDPRRIEPWPWILAGLLAFMIASSIGFYLIAASHPDPVIDRTPQPGVTR